jgi:hypothetical protein
VWQQQQNTWHAVGTVQKSDRKIVVRVKINIPNTQIQERSPSSLGTNTSIPS